MAKALDAAQKGDSPTRVTTNNTAVECVYQPPVGTTGEETFQYQVIEPGGGISAPATVTVDIKSRGLRWELVTGAHFRDRRCAGTRQIEGLRMTQRGVRTFGAALALCLFSTGASTQTSADKELANRREMLLMSYSAYKGYSYKTGSEVFGHMKPDRQTVFDAVVRAAFAPLYDLKGNPSGKRVIDFIEAVHGVWGMRKAERNGSYLFRVSVRFGPGVRDALSNSGNMSPDWWFGHVLLPMATGGDDDPKFTDFKSLLKTGGDVISFREAAEKPTLQITLLKSDNVTGEIELDFDSKKPLSCGCHCKPSNSDAGSSHATSTKDKHPEMLNRRVTLFTQPFSPPWTDTAAHCQNVY